MNLAVHRLAAVLSMAIASTAAAEDKPVPVTVHNFARAETDLYFSRTAADGAFGKLRHSRQLADVTKQDVVRMNRDTLYSSGVFDLQAAPLRITLPDSGKRFMSMQVISQDHYTVAVQYAPGRHDFTAHTVGTRYAYLIVRTLVDPRDPEDLKRAHQLQDAIGVEQASPGRFEVPRWDAVSQAKARDALAALGSLGGTRELFGSKAQVDPVDHLIGSSIGWGGNPRSAAIYASTYPPKNDGKVQHALTVRDVPIDGFWSVSVYNAKGYFEKNALGAYSLNSLTAKPNADGSVTVRFGGCTQDSLNCLPITPGWNYTVRLYRPRAAILDGSWSFPVAQPVQ